MVPRTVIIQRDAKGYGLRVSGDNPVFVESVKPDGAAWKAGVRSGDRIIKVNGTLVTKHNHQDVVQMIQLCGGHVGLTLLGMRPIANNNGSGNTATTSSSNNAGSLLGDSGPIGSSNTLSSGSTLPTSSSMLTHSLSSSSVHAGTHATGAQHNLAFHDPIHGTSDTGQPISPLPVTSSSSSSATTLSTHAISISDLNTPTNSNSSSTTSINHRPKHSLTHYQLKNIITPPLPANHGTLLEFERRKAMTIQAMLEEQRKHLQKLRDENARGDKHEKLERKLEEELKLATSNDPSTINPLNSNNATSFVLSPNASIGRYVLPLDSSLGNTAMAGLSAFAGSAGESNSAGSHHFLSSTSSPSSYSAHPTLQSNAHLHHQHHNHHHHNQHPSVAATRRHLSAENLHYFSKPSVKAGSIGSSTCIKSTSASCACESCTTNTTKKSHSFGQYDSHGGAVGSTNAAGHSNHLHGHSFEQSSSTSGLSSAGSSIHLHGNSCADLLAASNPLYAGSVERIITMESDEEPDGEDNDFGSEYETLFETFKDGTGSVSAASMTSTASGSNINIGPTHNINSSGSFSSNTRSSSSLNPPDSFESLLQSKNGKSLLQFVHFLLTQRLELNSLFFYILSDLFRKVCDRPSTSAAALSAQSTFSNGSTDNSFQLTLQQQIRRWAFEIYTTFLLWDSPLRLPEPVFTYAVAQNDSLLSGPACNNHQAFQDAISDLNSNISGVFEAYSAGCRIQVQSQLTAYRQQYTIGLSGIGIGRVMHAATLVQLMVADLSELPAQVKNTASGASCLLGQVTILLSYLLNNSAPSLIGSSSNLTGSNSSTGSIVQPQHQQASISNTSNSTASPTPLATCIAQLTCFTSLLYHCYPQLLIRLESGHVPAKLSKSALVNLPVPIFLSFHQHQNSYTLSASVSGQHKRHRSLPVASSGAHSHVPSSSQAGSVLASASFNAPIPYHLSSSSQPTGIHHQPHSASSPSSNNPTDRTNSFNSGSSVGGPLSTCSEMSTTSSSGSIGNIAHTNAATSPNNQVGGQGATFANASSTANPQQYTRSGHVFLPLTSNAFRIHNCAGCSHTVWAMFGWQCQSCLLVAHHWCLRSAADDLVCSAANDAELGEASGANLSPGALSGHSLTGNHHQLLTSSMSQLVSKNKRNGSRSTGGRLLGNILKKTGFSSSSLVGSAAHLAGAGVIGWPSSNDSFQLLGSKSFDQTSATAASNLIEPTSPLLSSSSSSNDDLNSTFGNLNVSAASNASEPFSANQPSLPPPPSSSTSSSTASVQRSESFKQKQRGLMKGCYRKKSDPTLPASTNESSSDHHLHLHHHANSVSGSHNSVHSLSSSDGEPDDDDLASRPLMMYRSASTNLNQATSGTTFGALPDQEYCMLEDEQSLSCPTQTPLPSTAAPIALPPPPPLPPRNPTQQAIRRACKRQDIIKELIATEKTHVKNLKILNDLFLVPIYTEQLLSTEQIDSVFANHSQLYELHCQIYQLFKQRKREQQRAIQRQLEFPRQNSSSSGTLLPGDIAIGATLVQIFDGDIGKRLEQAASIFCAKQTTGQEVLRAKLRKDSKLTTFLAEAEANKCCRRLQLKDMLASCFQRITKYPLLMDTLLKAMDNPDSDEYRLVEQACKKSKQILHNVNECVKLAENRAKLIDIQRKTEIMLPETTFEFGDKELLHQGQLTIRLKKSFEVLLLLCTDCLVVLVKEGDKLCLKNINKAAHPVIQIKNVLTRNNATDCRAFYLISKQENFMYEFVAASESERNHWLKQINETAVKCGGGSASNANRGTEIKLRDLTAKEDSTDQLKESFDEHFNNNDESSMMNKSVNDLDDNTNRLDDTNLLLDKSSVGALDLVPPAPKIEGTISFVRDDELSLQQFGRDVTITKPNIDVALRIKLIDVEIERLLHEKRQLIRQATTESESSAQDNSESSPGFGHLGISSESSEQALDIRAPQQQHKQTQTD